MTPALRVALRLAVAGGLLAALWHWLDGPEALAHLRQARPGWLALGFGLLSAQIVLSALRWRLTAARLGQHFGAGFAVREYYLAVLANMTLPGGVIGDAGRAVRARADAGLGVSVQAVVIERLAGQVALAAVLVPGLLLWPGWAGRGLGLLVLMVAAAGVAVWLARAGPGMLRGLGRSLARAWWRDGAWRAQLGLSLAILACNIGGFAACAVAVGAGLPAVAVPVIVPLTLAAMLVPVSISGWGLREGAAAVLWPLAGLTAEAGIAASIAFGLTALAASLPAVALLRRAGAPSAVIPQGGDAGGKRGG